MNHSLEERIEQLKLKNATEKMNVFGRLLVDNREMSLWEHDTKTLSWGVRRWRRKALKFAREHIRPLAPEADLHPHDYDPKPIMAAAAREGFQTLLLVPPLGSASMLPYFKGTAFQVAVVGEEFATECGGLALLLLAHNLGIVPLLLSGSLRNIFRQMIPFYLKSYILGRPECMAFAITEPGAGSDVEETEGGAKAKLVTTAKYSPEKKGYIINGQKCFISDGAIADKVTVYAKLEDEGIESWTCFLVEKGMPGFSVGRSERKMGQRASDASELIFDNVFVPNKNVVGKLRSGWANNRNVLNYSRPVVGAMALGHGRGAFERCLEFCRKTNLGPKRLIEYQDVQLELADMAISLWAARSMIWQSCKQFRCYQSGSASAKVFASDTAFKVCNQAMELMGDQGYLHKNGVERSWRDSRLTQIYEGTNQINRLALFEHHLSTDFGMATD
ncbi:MAG: acyl-CoA dehydrogenase [Deltaproteobacteria bacterium HGW-Deltaproteobacteria-13]|jgi:alkylation response protein AidB-like acyl-CoA dehydrogenase|nr:MAG: acyl-CoA dehydrogenase [Deltaproteobacteria bacterium HGW-Deltaproteobacteria-13]